MLTSMAFGEIWVFEVPEMLLVVDIFVFVNVTAVDFAISGGVSFLYPPHPSSTFTSLLTLAA